MAKFEKEEQIAKYEVRLKNGAKNDASGTPESKTIIRYVGL
jgi:hypothetical protein